MDRVAKAKKKYRSVDDSEPFVKKNITNDPKYRDCCTFETDIPRVLMPCGHAITASSMYQEIKS